jgi:hypothetical protein
MKISSLQKGLVGHWTMSQDSLKGSLLADKTPYENDGTIYGATFTTDRKGKANSAMSFDGVDDYIDCGSNESLSFDDALTISAYINIESGKSYTLVAKSERKNGDFAVTLYSGNNRLYYFVNGSYNCINYASYYNSIHHVAITHVSGEKAKFYIDGMFIPHSNSVLTLSPDVLKTLYIGKGGYDYAHKTIDDVRIYNRALSQEEITLLYNSYNPKIQL